ncbi:MAG: hypothetical protein EOP49_50905 [Sphingobacteriales bacterium]|nr:MAG: hypothetical protein EOP49_50905 [Sphingobacteriales bacterium]
MAIHLRSMHFCRYMNKEDAMIKTVWDAVAAHTNILYTEVRTGKLSFVICRRPLFLFARYYKIDLSLSTDQNLLMLVASSTMQAVCTVARANVLPVLAANHHFNKDLLYRSGLAEQVASI